MSFLRATIWAVLGTSLMTGCGKRQGTVAQEATQAQTSGDPFPGKTASNPKAGNADYLPVGFDKLSGFPLKVIFEMTNPVTFASVPKLNASIPDPVKALDGKAVAVTGFMLPLKLEDGRTREFLLMKNRSLCCFGIPLEINDWVCVRMTNQPVKSVMDVPMTVYGTIHIGEILENGQMAGIYRLEGSKLKTGDF